MAELNPLKSKVAKRIAIVEDDNGLRAQLEKILQSAEGVRCTAFFHPRRRPCASS